jgi:exopolysaccharide biosynthesis predicted pyruvyltransferase EpsI
MSIKDFLEKYSKEHIFYKPNNGNGGDSLIALGAFTLFKQMNIKYTIINDQTDITNQIVFYAGGGNLVKEYSQAFDFISSNHERVKELILLPHTINDNAELVKTLGKNTTLLCREKVTYKYIQDLNPQCNYFLIEDLAFSLAIPELKKQFKTNIIPILSNKHVLKMFRYQGQVFSPIMNVLFGKELNTFRIDHEKTEINKPNDNLDLSLLILYDGNMSDEHLVEQNVVDILSVINKYNIVNTNRLHVCIGAALLGKQVNFYPNSYYKNESIFLMSLKDKFPNVRWCGKRTIE